MANTNKNIFNNFSFSKKYKKELIEFFKNNTTIEAGGNLLFDGEYNYPLQIPEEFADLIFELKKSNKKNKLKIFLEIGFGHGYTNTILNKFFNFDLNCAIDTFGPHINGNTLLPNLRFKNLNLICQNSKSKNTKNILKKFGKFDLILIDADHGYNSAKNDFELSLEITHKNSIIIVHDIKLKNSGSKKLWEELKKIKKYNLKEIYCNKHQFKYGVGILKFKN